MTKDHDRVVRVGHLTKIRAGEESRPFERWKKYDEGWRTISEVGSVPKERIFRVDEVNTATLLKRELISMAVIWHYS